MNSKRITVSIPHHLYSQLVEQVPERQISKFVSESVEQRLLKEKRQYTNPVRDFMELRDELPKRSREEIIEAINRGRK